MLRYTSGAKLSNTIDLISSKLHLSILLLLKVAYVSFELPIYSLVVVRGTSLSTIL